MPSIDHVFRSFLQPAPEKPFRFSLLTLLSVTTLAAFVFTIAFSKHWRPDERLLLAFWGAGLILGVSAGRFRGNAGILSGAIAAVVGCLLAVFLQHGPQWRLQVGEPPTFSYVAFVVGAGWILAMLVAGTYAAVCNGSLQRFLTHQRTRSLGLVVIALIVGIMAVRYWTLPRTWRHAWIIASDSAEPIGTPRLFHLTPDGQELLVVRSPPATGKRDQPTRFIRSTLTGLTSREFPLDWNESNVVFSSDGKRLVVGQLNRFRLLDVATGKTLFTWQLPTRSDESLEQMQFDSSGTQLLLTTQTSRIQRLYTIDLSGQQKPRVELFPFAGRLFLSPRGNILVKILEGNDETGALSAELVRRSDEQVLQRLTDLRGHEKPVFSPDESAVAFGKRVCQLSSGKVTPFAGQVIGIVPGGRVVVFETDVQSFWDAAAPSWLRDMPFVQLTFQRRIMARLSLVELNSGRVLAVSPDFELMILPKISTEAATVAATSRSGQIRVWKVPQG